MCFLNWKKLKIPIQKLQKMAEGKGCDVCEGEHDGNFYNFCRCTCHDKMARDVNFP